MEKGRIKRKWKINKSINQNYWWTYV